MRKLCRIYSISSRKYAISGNLVGEKALMSIRDI